MYLHHPLTHPLMGLEGMPNQQEIIINYKNRKKMKEQHYEAPQVEVIEVEVEQGFAGSLQGSSGVGESMGGGGSTVWPD